ncbi:MAG: hypothetical protein N2Z72_05485 [Bacteroidales bacterium]|nr:hypothetical protein [Bacteroidales bacterium]
MVEVHASDLLWLSMASAATLAGNATMVGAIAHLIVVEVATCQGIRISFVIFLKTFLILTLLTMLIPVAVLGFEWFMFS